MVNFLKGKTQNNLKLQENSYEADLTGVLSKSNVSVDA
jgi:hypothetical protein